MSAPYISSTLRRMAEARGFTVEVRTHTARRPKGWPTSSTKPVHLKRADGSHVASFVDGLAAITYLKGLEA